MIHSKIKRILAFTIACILLCAFSSQALATQVYVMSSAAVYTTPSSSGKKLGTLKAGTQVDQVAVKGGWAMVKKGGNTAYMKASALAEIEDCNDITAYTKAATPMYNGFTSGAKKLGTIPKGDAVTVMAKAGQIAYVRYGSYKGYVKTDNLTTSAPNTEDQEAVESNVSRTVYANKDNAKVYNISGRVIGHINANTEMQLTGINGNICRVVKDGKTAYMYQSDLSTEKVDVEDDSTASRIVYVNKNGAKVYNISGKVISSVDANTALTLTGINGNICRVVNGNTTAYMYKSDLSTEKVDVEDDSTASLTVYVNKDGAKVYNISGKAISSVDANTALTLTGINGNICRVVNGNTTAYMYKSDLSTEKVDVEDDSTASLTVYVNKDGAKVYNISGKAIGTLKVNTALTLTGINGNVCRVHNGSDTAYMKKSDLSETKVEEESDNNVVDIPNTTGYVNKDGAKVYDANGNTIATLSVNTAVTVSAYNDTLCQVVNGSTVGYMLKTDISTSKVEETDKNYTLKYGDTGEAVKKIQSRLKELGYFTGSIGGNFLSLTQSAVAAFQSAAKLTANGVVDYKTLEAMFDDDAPKNTSSSGGTGNSTATPAKGKAIEMDWWKSDIQSIFARGTIATITDVATGLSWREKRTGGTNHADVQPVTAADTAALKKAYGGSWSWNRRAIFVTINGVNYAASMNGMPHGSGSISGNNFDGHHCIHFTNSRTHGSNKVCSLHQAAIKKALAATL